MEDLFNIRQCLPKYIKMTAYIEGLLFMFIRMHKVSRFTVYHIIYLYISIDCAKLH